LGNEKKYGLRLCPCRLRDGTREKDLELICPCNFKAQGVWKDKGRCWCGLFVKRGE
jgi:ferredoxin-thioredoxin reductase catalytic chain